MNGNMENYKKLRKGFTLIEIIIVASIFSIIVVGIASSFISGMNIWGRAYNTDFTQADVLLTLEKITAQLRQSVDISVIGFEGDSKNISFPVVIRNYVARLTYEFDSMDKMLRQRRSNLEDIIAKKDYTQSTEKAMVSIDDFSLRYFYFDADEGAFVWGDTWEKEKGRFIAVQIEVKVAENKYTKTVFIPGA